MMKRNFKFFGDNNSFTMFLPLPGPYNNLSFIDDDTDVPTNIMFEWVNQFEHREFALARLETYEGEITDFSWWYDFLVGNLNDNEYLPHYPPIYQIRSEWGSRCYSEGDVNIPHNRRMVHIDVKVYIR